MRPTLWAILVGGVIAATAGSARAQFYGGINPVAASYGNAGPAGIYNTPGAYATTWGVPSFGYPRTYSTFTSPYGAGYGFGYYPYTYVPGYYGYRLWRPGFVAPGYLYGSGYYGTVTTPYQGLTGGYRVPIGYYAPGFGPPSWLGW